jgi:four helix bundle protein
MRYKSFTEMSVWQHASKLATEIFKLTINLPRSEDYGLTSQIRRSSNGIGACISEGFGRNTNRDKIKYYVIGRGSAFETQNHLIYGKNVNYFDAQVIQTLLKKYDNLIFELNKVIKYLEDEDN